MYSPWPQFPSHEARLTITTAFKASQHSLQYTFISDDEHEQESKYTQL